jgi:hypothetical protein
MALGFLGAGRQAFKKPKREANAMTGYAGPIEKQMLKNTYELQTPMMVG